MNDKIFTKFMASRVVSKKALRQLTRDLNNMTPSELSFNELMKELNK